MKKDNIKYMNYRGRVIKVKVIVEYDVFKGICVREENNKIANNIWVDKNDLFDNRKKLTKG